ncbi:MAG: hypothetical protein HYY24_18720 [Verrucomicrobia bacterium]|nr:hypothetical protein [Verrucomicrobiota bacterium]
MNGPATTLTVKLVARPKRIVLLIDPSHTTGEELDAFIFGCNRLWGGRFNAIIPTDGTTISPDWWKLLEVVDPDYIHSLTPLEDPLVHRINRRILPARISEVLAKDRATGHVRIMPSLEAVSVGEIPRFICSQRGTLFNPFFVCLQASGQRSPHRSFLLRNFGLYPGDLGTKEMFRDLPHIVVEEKNETPARLLGSLLNQMKGQQFMFPHELCWMYSVPRFYADSHLFSRGLHIVVGDHPLDVAYAWNRAWTGDHWHPPEVYWLSRADAENPELLAALKAWIERTFWRGTERCGRVVSYSEEKPLLQKVAEALRCGACFAYEISPLDPESYPLPDVHSLGGRHANEPPHYTEQVILSEESALVGFPAPRFVSGGDSQGGWVVDVGLEYRPERYTWTNRRPRWNLPKRIGISWLFFRGRDSRVIRGGSLSVAVSGRENQLELRVPSDEEVFGAMFHRHGSNSEAPHPQPPCHLNRFSTSDNGKFLRGFIDLFGNLWNAGQVFENPFWRETLARMAGRPEDAFDERRAKLQGILTEVLAEYPAGVSATHPELPKLAERMTNRVTLRDPIPEDLTEDQIRGSFSEMRHAALKADPDHGWWRANENFTSEAQHDFEFLVEAGILLQGAKLTCPRCGTGEWYLVDEMKTQMQCRGCFNTFALSISPQWSFRLNGLVRKAIRNYGLVPLVQVLCTTQSRGCDFFMFLPPQDVFLDDDKDRLTDLDLFFIKDGRFVVGEVKSNPKGFKRSESTAETSASGNPPPSVDSPRFKYEDLQDLWIVARELLPDEVVIATGMGDWPEGLKKEIAELREALAGKDVIVSAFQFHWPS